MSSAIDSLGGQTERDPAASASSAAPNEALEVLAQSHRRAIKRLSDARSEAVNLGEEAGSDALKVLLAQQLDAEHLLSAQQARMAESDLSPEDGRLLALEHRKAAELLTQSQGDIAIHVATVTDGQIALVLLRGNREAAAILMEAWMRVKDVLAS